MIVLFFVQGSTSVHFSDGSNGKPGMGYTFAVLAAVREDLH